MTREVATEDLGTSIADRERCTSWGSHTPVISDMTGKASRAGA